MRILLIGAPGSGKGTQAARIAAHFGIVHISSGELLRHHVEQGTDIGRSVEDALARGDLVSDSLVLDVLREPVATASRHGGYVLDGYPRTLAQAKAAHDDARAVGTWVQVAVFLEVPHDLLIERIVARGQQQGRSDDNTAVLRHRIELFDEATPPLLEYYAGRQVLLTVDGSRSVDDVGADIIAELERVRPHLS